MKLPFAPEFAETYFIEQFAKVTSRPASAAEEL
jgi:hypothetical protein